MAGELGVLIGAVGAHRPGGAQHAAGLQLAGAVGTLAVGQGLGGEVGLLLLAVGHFLQHDHGGAGAEDAVSGHGPLDVHQDGVVLVVGAQVAQLEPVVQGRVGEGAVKAVGDELGGVHLHRQLAVAVGGVGVVLVAGFSGSTVAHGHILAAVVPAQVDAAPEGDLPHIGRAVRLHQVELRLGGGHQGDGVQGVELQLGGVPLPAGQGLPGDGAQVEVLA